MTKKKEMRIKEVGATINLGNFSTLHVTVGESSEYAGLELHRTTSYLKNIAQQVGGILNLPEDLADGKKIKKPALAIDHNNLEQDYLFSTEIPIFYDHQAHAYFDEKGNPLTSVTQFLGQYYPMKKEIAKEYLSFASSFGNLVHTAIQNALIGKSPKKELTKAVVDDVLKNIGKYDKVFVEQMVADPDLGLAGRFDILTYNMLENAYTLWDIKTNSDLTIEVESSLPQKAKDFLEDYWNPDTIYGEHCLQLNIYAYMLEKVSKKQIKDIKIIHVPDGFERIYVVPKIDVEKLLGMLKNE